MIKGLTSLLKFKVIILAVLCLSVAVAWPQWRSALKTQGYYGYGYGYGYDSSEDFESGGSGEFESNPGTNTGGEYGSDFESEGSNEFESGGGSEGNFEPGDSSEFEGGGEVTPEEETDCTPDEKTGRKKCCGLPCGPPREPKVKNIEVDIDVVPCFSPNKIKLGSRGLVRVVIKGSRKLNVKTIDTGSILFAGAKPIKWHVGHFVCTCEDKDFKKDLFLVFRKCDLVDLTTTSTEAVLTGETLTGTFFTGTDSVEIYDCTR